MCAATSRRRLVGGHTATGRTTGSSRSICSLRHRSMITEIASNLHLAAMQTGTARPPPRRIGWSTTEDRLRALLASATASVEERRLAADELWISRHAFEIEKSGTASAQVVEHLRLGRSGSRRLSARVAWLPFLADPAGRVVDPDEIKSRAHRYFAELFEALPQKFPKEDAGLTRLLVGSLTPKCTISTGRPRVSQAEKDTMGRFRGRGDAPGDGVCRLELGLGGNFPERRRAQRRMGSGPSNVLGSIPDAPPIVANSRTCQRKDVSFRYWTGVPAAEFGLAWISKKCAACSS